MLHNPLTLSVVMGLISAVLGALANLLAGTVMRLSPPRNFLAFNFMLFVGLMLPFAPWFFHFQPDPASLLLFLIISVADAAANFLYFKAFELNTALTASALLGLSPLFALLMAPLFTNISSTPGIRQVLGILMILGGLLFIQPGLLAGLGHSAGKAGNGWFPLMAALLSAILFGVTLYPTKLLLASGVTNAYSFYLLRAGLIGGGLWLVLKPDHSWVNWRTAAITAGRASIVISQWLLLLYALVLGLPSVVKSVGDTSPLFVVLFSAVFLRQKINWKQGLAAGAITAGIILVTFSF